MITFEVVRTGLEYVEVSWNVRLGQLTEPVYYLLAQTLNVLAPVESVEVLKFSAHLRVPTPTEEVLETIRQALLENDELQQVLDAEYEVLILQ